MMEGKEIVNMTAIIHTIGTDKDKDRPTINFFIGYTHESFDEVKDKLELFWDTIRK